MPRQVMSRAKPEIEKWADDRITIAGFQSLRNGSDLSAYVRDAPVHAFNEEEYQRFDIRPVKRLIKFLVKTPFEGRKPNPGSPDAPCAACCPCCNWQKEPGLGTSYGRE